MKTPRDIYGTDFADHLVRRWDYVIVHQTGSHIVLRTQTPSGQTVSVPVQKPMKVGTLNGIVRSIAEHKSVTRLDALRGL